MLESPICIDKSTRATRLTWATFQLPPGTSAPLSMLPSPPEGGVRGVRGVGRGGGVVGEGGRWVGEGVRG